MNTSVPFDSMPAWLLVVGGVLVLVQLGLEIYALVDMLKRPPELLALGGRKWLWAIIILGVNWIGAAVYLAAGRKPAPVAEIEPATPASERADAAAEALYGPREWNRRS